jgi:pyruvate,water dikinase
MKLAQTVGHYRQTVPHLNHDLKHVSDEATIALGQFRLRELVYGELISTGLILVSALTGLIVLIARIVAPISKEPDKVLSRLAEVWGNSAARYHSETLLRLAHLAKKDLALARYIAGVQNSYKDYQTALAGTQFLTEFEAYLADHGDRAVYEPDMSYPRYREQVVRLLQTVGQYTRLAVDGHLENPSRTPPSIAQILQSLVGPNHSRANWLPWRQMLALPLMGLLRRLYALRDEMRAAEASGMAAVRAWDLVVAERWVKQGYLTRTEDYFWLTMEEIERAIVAEDDAALYLKPAIAARKEAFKGYAEMKMPVVVKDSEMPGLYLSDIAVQEVLSGTLMGLPVSPGQVQGVIRILNEHDTLDQIPEGTILVTPSTDPAMLAFFPLAAGLIVEVGGMLSHGSIIAREYGLPAVSNITDARKRLKSGDRVLLDGTTGVVQILEPAEARQPAQEASLSKSIKR